jgi:hypothetical protein
MQGVVHGVLSLAPSPLHLCQGLSLLSTIISARGLAAMPRPSISFAMVTSASPGSAKASTAARSSAYETALVRPWEPSSDFHLAMANPPPLGSLLAAVFGPGPTIRPVVLRPRPPYLPHPIISLARLPGVVRVRSKAYSLSRFH